MAFTVPEQAPSFGLGLSYPTASCRGSITAGLSLPGGGAGVGLAPLDLECRIVETARFLFNIDQALAGYMVLCQAPSMHLVFNRPDHTSRREGKTVPDPEACLAHLQRYQFLTLERYEEMQDQLEGMDATMDDMQYQLATQEESYTTQLARQASEHAESLRRCQEEVVSCLAK